MEDDDGDRDGDDDVHEMRWKRRRRRREGSRRILRLYRLTVQFHPQGADFAFPDRFRLMKRANLTPTLYLAGENLLARGGRLERKI